MTQEIRDFYLNRGLYDPLKFSSNLDFGRFLRFIDNFDGFCPFCKKNTTYKVEEPISKKINNLSHWLQTEQSQIHGNYFITFYCARHSGHRINFVVNLDNMMAQKIGQLPSLADLATGEYEKYRTLLDKSISNEFFKAITSATHDYSIGAFVYLRRVFEFIIDERFKVLSEDGTLTVSEKDFIGFRIKDKIKTLKKHLPKLLTKNTHIYGVLSKGIHELNEDECRKIFPILKEFTTFILEEEIDRKKTEARKDELQKELNRFNQDINNK